ncbi:MAG: histidine phosphatase family protein [Anaerolineae bacterium]|nr:histidine phosphatase family protein [Anaerolineae bacterium]
MAVKRVMFIRPGETAWNKNGRWQGHVAVPLNEHGQAQAKRLAKFIRPIGLTALYSSDLRRARDTAEIIAQYTDLKPIYDPRLRERGMGDWQGMTLDEIVVWYPESYQRVQADPQGFQVPGGESRRQVAERVRMAFDDIIGRGGDTVGIITHTTALRSLLDELVPDSDAYNLYFKNMSVTTIMRQEDGLWRITQLDDVTHLEGVSSAAFYELEEGKKNDSSD